jgi:ribonuclease HI
MSISAPHFLLKADCDRLRRPGTWHFALQTADGSPQVEVEDAEPTISGERLELLTVIRGLEAIDRPAHVTLLTSSSYVRRGIKYGLEEWRANNWQWERHGHMVPIKNGDLWRRLDRALHVHRVQCQVLRFDGSHETKPAAQCQLKTSPASSSANSQHQTTAAPASNTRSHRRARVSFRRHFRETATAFRLRLAQFGTVFLPKPRLE